jgi:autotransporter-associated beta strand protein
MAAMARHLHPHHRPPLAPARLWPLIAVVLLAAGRSHAVNYEVYPGSAFYLNQMLDRSTWSFVADHCNGLYHHPVGFSELDAAAEETYAAHFKNRFAMVEGDMGNGSTTGDVANLQRMTALGLTPVAAFVNRPSSNPAVWRQLVRNNAAQGAPSYEMLAPHRLDDSPLGWYDPARDYARTNMLVAGCIGSGVDAPVYLYVNEGAAYRKTIHDLRDWSVANGKRFNYLVSPNNSYNAALLEDTRFLVRDLEDKGHEPDVYGIVLYGERPVDLTPEKTTVNGVDQPATTITGLAYYLIKHRDGEPGTLDLSARRDNLDHGAGVTGPTLAGSSQTIALPGTAASTWTIRMKDNSPWLDYAGVLRARATGASGDWLVAFASGGSNITQQVLSDRGRIFVGAERWLPGTTREITMTVTPRVATPGAFKLVVEALPHDGVDHALDVICFQHGTPANTPPTLAIEARPQVTREGLPLGALWFTCGDAETESPVLTVTATSSNTTLVPPSGLIFGRSNIQRWLRIVPAAGQSGSTNVTVTVSDGTLTKSTVLPVVVERTTVLPATKANNAVNLEQGTSWTAAKAPGIADQAVWDATVTGPNTTTVASPLTIAGLRVTQPGGDVTIRADSLLSLGVSGVDLSTSTRDLFLAGSIALDESAAWNIATGRLVRATHGISGAGGITKSGNGRLELLGNDEFSSPLTVNAGEVVKQGAGTQSATAVAGNAVLRVSHSAGFGNGGLTVTAANSSTARVEISGGISVLAGKSVTINSRTSDTDAIVSQGNNAFGGNLAISTGGSLCAISSQTGTLTLGGTLSSIATGNRTFTLRGPSSGVVTGNITDGSGTVGIIKKGAGRWTLAGTHDFTGPVLVQEGYLAINNALPVQPVTVSPDAMLSGSGSIGGAVTVSGNHSPGDGVGNQMLDGSLAYLAGSTLIWEIGSHSGAADALTASSATFAASSRLDVLAAPAGGAVDYADAFWRQPRQWTVLTAASVSGTPVLGTVSADATGKPAAPFGQWRIVADSTSIALAWTPGDPFDAWRYARFGASWNVAAVSGATVDPDADGWNNRDEWIAGTIPTDRSSRFTVVPDGAGISFTRITGRSYQVLTATHPAGPWSHHADAPAGAGRITIAPPANPGPRRFYRVVIRIFP